MRLARLYCLAAAFAAAAAGHAQGREVGKIEGGARVGLTVPLGGYHGGRAAAGMGVGIELRRNVRRSAFDYGVLLNITSAVRHFGAKGRDGVLTQNNRSADVVALGGYNFRQGRRLNPYVGFGVGASFNDVVGDRVHGPSGGRSVVFVPRAGIELFSHLRFGLDIQINRRGYNNAEAYVAVVLGGRPE